MDYTKKPGERLENIGTLKNKEKPVISIVTPFYNGGDTLLETANSVRNQTYPYFEWIIVDDGSKDKSSLDVLSKLEKEDTRIIVYHKENGGPAVARDYGISKACHSSKYVLFLDCDDLIDQTMLECLYWTLETHKDASFAYTAMVNFGDQEFLWEKYLTVEREIIENLISTCSMVRKEDLLEVGGFGITEKAMYEDWNLWLKLLAAGKKPVRISAPLFWYRQRNNQGEFSRAQKNNSRAMEYVNATAQTIKDDVEVIQFPREGNRYATVGSYSDMILPTYKKDNVKKILFLFPWMIVGGADYFNLDLIKRLDKEKYEAIVLTTLPSENPLRQEFCQYAKEVYDMASFLDRSDYINFVDYMIGSRNVSMVVVSNTPYGYYMLPYLKGKYPTIPFIDYIHSIDFRDKRGGFGRCSMDVDFCLSHTYTCNQFTQMQLETIFHKKNVDTLYIGTDDHYYNPENFDKGQMREKYGIPKNKTVVSFIARLATEKRPLMFVSIAKKLLAESDDFFFVIAGDGPLMEEVSHATFKDASIKMLGMITETEEVYAFSDITVNCSCLEGLALTSYESLSMNVPVVSSDVGGQKELIDEKVGGMVPYHENGTKEEYEQEILEFCHQIKLVKDTMDAKRRNCRQRIQEKFSVSLLIQNFERIIEETIEQEKNKKLEIADSSMIYPLALEGFYDEYYYFCKQYLETKFAINYLSDKEKVSFSPRKIKVKAVLNRHGAQREATLVNDALRSFKHLIKEFIYFIRNVILAIPACAKLIYKLIFR